MNEKNLHARLLNTHKIHRWKDPPHTSLLKCLRTGHLCLPGSLLSDSVVCAMYPMQVPVYNKKLMDKCSHCAAPFTISPECIEVVSFGRKRYQVINDTTVLKFGKFLCPS